MGAVEAQGDQGITQLGRRGLEATMGDMSIGAVEGVEVAGLGVGHAQHAAQKLFDILGGTDVGDRAEDLGPGTVPALLEGLDGDDVADGAVGLGVT